MEILLAIKRGTRRMSNADDTTDMATTPAIAATSSTNDESSSLSQPVLNVSSELPFLVTQWLSQYEPAGSHSDNPSANNNNDNLERQLTSTTNAVGSEEERRAAVRRLRHAASEMAAAFATLGAFGTASLVRTTNLWCSPCFHSEGIVVSYTLCTYFLS